VLKAAAFEEFLKFPLDGLWQYHALAYQMYLERGLVFLDKLVKKGSFRVMALVYKRANT
jgi:hypothetical protein